MGQETNIRSMENCPLVAVDTVDSVGSDCEEKAANNYSGNAFKIVVKPFQATHEAD